MKKKDLFLHMKVLNDAYPLWTHNRFRQAVLENIENAKPEMEKLEKMQKEDRECLKEYDEKHNPLILKYGNEVKEQKGFFTPPVEGDAGYKAYTKEYNKLQEEYAEDIKKWEAKNKKFTDEILAEEVRLKPYTVSIEFVPETLPDPIFAYLVSNKIIQN
jgi:hypothetical protein